MGKGGRIAVGSVVATLLILGAVALCAIGIGFLVVESSFDSEAVRVSAPVVAADPSASTITVELSVGGRSYRPEVTWFGGTLPEVGSYADVEYVPEDPSTVRAAGSNAIGTTGWVLTGLAVLPTLLAVAVGIGTVFWARRAGRSALLNPFAPLPAAPGPWTRSGPWGGPPPPGSRQPGPGQPGSGRTGPPWGGR